MREPSKLVKLAREHKLPLKEVLSNYSYETRKLYCREFKKERPDLDLLDIQAYEIVNRYYKMKEVKKE